MKKLILIAFLLLPMLYGCEHFPQKPGTTVVEQTVKIDPKFLEGCEELPPALAKDLDGLLMEDLVLIEKYGICKNKQNDSVKLIKKLANIKE